MGRSKIRRKTVRGRKSESGLLNGFGLTQRARSGADGVESRIRLGALRLLKYAMNSPTVYETVTHSRERTPSPVKTETTNPFPLRPLRLCVFHFSDFRKFLARRIRNNPPPLCV